jgi:hypothetical protein
VNSIEKSFKILKDQVVWALTHRGLINDSEIFNHLRRTLTYLETGSWNMSAEIMETQSETVVLTLPDVQNKPFFD